MLSNQAMVPSPPATRTVQGVSPSRRHHVSIAVGSCSAKSITCAGFNNPLNNDKISSLSLLPDFLFPRK